MIRFLTAGWRLLELDEEEALASLTEVWRARFGYSPDFSEDGDAVTGVHEPGEQGERKLQVWRAANPAAIEQASRMLRLRYQLVRVRVVTRTRDQGTTEASVYDDWEPELEERPYDLDAVSVWPHQPLHPVRDAVVIEHVEQPGRCIHRVRNNPRVLYSLPAETVETALTFPSAEAGWRWIDEFGGDRPLRIVYRSVALAAEDQAAREVVEEMRG